MAHRKQKSIPLPEVLFVALIIGLLTAVAIPPMVYSSDTRAAECKANAALLNAKLQRYAAQHNGWTPADQAEFEGLLAADKGLPAGAMPKCPHGLPYVYDPATGRIVAHKH